MSTATTPTAEPVATVAIGRAGATNAGLLAAAIVGLSRPWIAAKLDEFRATQTAKVLGDTLA